MTEVKDEPLDDSASFIGEGDIELLPHEQTLMVESIQDDVLFVTGRGLGVERLFLNHLIMYSDQKLLFLVLNTNQYDESYFLAKMKETGLPCQPKLVNADVSVKDREAVYLEGGVQFITSRILMVDLLTGRIPVNHVAGILVYRAHQVLNSFQESFILRLYRENKKDGLVKGFSDVPTSMSSLGQLQRVIDRLYIKKIIIVPRFHEKVKLSLSDPILIEWNVSLPPTLRRVQSTFLDFIRCCIRELKQCSLAAKTEEDGDDLSSNRLVSYTTTLLEKQLLDRKSYISDKQKRLLSDLELLRSLLRMAEGVDPASLMTRLKTIRSDKEAIDKNGGWLLSASTSRLMTDLDSLCGLGKDKKFTAPSKWTVLQNVIEEIKQVQLAAHQIGPQGPSILVFASDEMVCRQLDDVIIGGVAWAEWLARRQLNVYPREREPERKALWEPEFTRMYMGASVSAEARSELVTDLQKNQKVTARAARKRRKAAEDMIGTSSDGSKQSKIVQFGIMQYKRKNTGAEAGPSTVVEPKEEPEDEVVEEEGTTTAKTIAEYPEAALVITPCGEKYSTLRYLESAKPNFIIFYNPDLATMRQVEIYKACNPSIHLETHQLQYTESTEEERHLAAINNENLAFESIIREKAKLLVSRSWDVSREDPPRIGRSTRDGGGGGGDGAELEDGQRPKIVVDMREFNSELPTTIYKKGFDVCAATLEVGDYVLSPGISVERKALDDLSQSLQSGRVFKQVEQMLLHYPNSVLLVESNSKLKNKIVNGGPFQGEISRHCREIRAQLCALVRASPRLKLIWSLSPANSAEYFAELKINHAEPDVEKAVALRGDEAANTGESQDDSSSVAKTKPKKPNGAIMRSLCANLSWMAGGDVRAMMVGGKVKNLRELFTTASSSSSSLHDVILDSHADQISILSSFDFRNNSA